MSTHVAAKKKGGLTKHFGGNVGVLPTQQGQFAVPIFTQQEETIEMFMQKVWDEGTADQIRALISLTYPNGEKIIDIRRKSDIIIEIIGMLKVNPFDEVIEFLKESTSPNYILWDQDSMGPSITKFERELALHEDEEIGVKNVGRCRSCSSNELIFVKKQMRSGDEATTIFVRCVLCGKRWRE